MLVSHPQPPWHNTVAVIAVPTAWANNCEAPLYTFGEATPILLKWLLSPKYPKQRTSCGYLSYFAQFNIGGSPIACLTPYYSALYM